MTAMDNIVNAPASSPSVEKAYLRFAHAETMIPFVSLLVRARARVRVDVYAHGCVHLCVDVHLYAHVYELVCVRAHLCSSVYVCACAHLRVCLCACVHVIVGVYTKDLPCHVGLVSRRSSNHIRFNT